MDICACYNYCWWLKSCTSWYVVGITYVNLHHGLFRFDTLGVDTLIPKAKCRPISHDRKLLPQMVVCLGREMGPRKFQENPGWWNIIIWPDIWFAGWWQLKDFWNFHPQNWGNDSQFDEHIFQMGWFNHQLVWKPLWGSTMIYCGDGMFRPWKGVVWILRVIMKALNRRKNSFLHWKNEEFFRDIHWSWVGKTHFGIEHSRLYMNVYNIYNH